jgi:integrase
MKWKYLEGVRGIRYREHPTRKHGAIPDKYFTICYQYQGERKEEGFGWLSEGRTLKKAMKRLEELKEAARDPEIKNPDGTAKATRLYEARQAEESRRTEEAKAKEQRERDNLTFGQFFKKTYLPISKTNKKRESWKKEEEHYRLYLEPVLGNRPLREIKPLNVERVKKNILDAGRSPRFLQYCLATFRQVWNMARRDGLVSEDSPTKAVKIPKIENKRVRFLSQEEAADLLNHLKAVNLTIHDMAFLSLFSGMRFGEIKSLKWGAVDLGRGLITVFDGKGTKTRTAYMTTEVKEMLAARERMDPESLVFPTHDGREYSDTPTTFREAVEALGLNKGITDPRQKVVFHTLRHSYASWLVEAGTDIYNVKELLGHGTIAMTERYSHLAPDSLQNTVKKLPTLPTGDQGKEGKVVSLKKG